MQITQIVHIAIEGVGLTFLYRVADHRTSPELISSEPSAPVPPAHHKKKFIRVGHLLDIMVYDSTCKTKMRDKKAVRGAV